MEWYQIQNANAIDTPQLILYKDRIQQNIHAAINMINDVNRLRPHVKTNKTAEVCSMMMQAGISKFKCATIAEAEMLAMLYAADVLLAYQPVGPKAIRLLQLVNAYPQTIFSCLVDNINTAVELSALFYGNGKKVNVFIDLNVGMNRTGIKPLHAFDLFTRLQQLKGIVVVGLHAYDGHLRDASLQLRQQKSDTAFSDVNMLGDKIENVTGNPLTIVAGGSPSFPTHINRNVECSPGTFVYWDWGYQQKLTDEPFVFAALVITRVISIIDETTITTDLGHKSVAAENPFPRVYFLNAPAVKEIGQSEEHLVLQVNDSSLFTVGDVLYAVPLHICPTVALYEKAIVVEDNNIVNNWRITARDRSINF